MKRKIKKGPGKARQMPVKDLRHVVTTYNRCSYVTAGKKYRILSWCGPVATVQDDTSYSMTAPLEGTSAHLDNQGSWEHPFK